jgi:hypothetical protein
LDRSYQETRRDLRCTLHGRPCRPLVCQLPAACDIRKPRHTCTVQLTLEWDGRRGDDDARFVLVLQALSAVDVSHARAGSPCDVCAAALPLNATAGKWWTYKTSMCRVPKKPRRKPWLSAADDSRWTETTRQPGCSRIHTRRFSRAHHFGHSASAGLSASTP